MDTSAHTDGSKRPKSCQHSVGPGITFFICGAFRVGEPVQVAGGGHRVAELWCLTIRTCGVFTKFLGGGLLNESKLYCDDEGQKKKGYLIVCIFKTKIFYLVKQEDRDIIKEGHGSFGAIGAALARKW